MIDQDKIRKTITTTIPLSLYVDCKKRGIKMPVLIMLGYKAMNKTDVLEQEHKQLTIKVERMSATMQRISQENYTMKEQLEKLNE